jgi:hypothetical protein
MRDFNDIQNEARSIRANIQTAYKLIKDAKARYVKQKLRLRSKAHTEASETLFKDLGEYDSLNDIQEVYGYDGITLAEHDRLVSLWGQREEFEKSGKVYNDRVVEMLDKAAARLNEPYQDFLDDYDKQNRQYLRNVQQSFILTGVYHE